MTRKRKARRGNQKSREIWAYNALLGSLAMVKPALYKIHTHPRSSPAAKEMASNIIILIERLDHELRTNRIDPPPES